MKTKLDTVATAAIRESSWMTCCKVPKCDVIALQEMYDTARKIENNLVMYWCLSRNDKKVTDFRKEMQCVQDVGLYLVLVSFAAGVYGCSRECGATDRVGGRGGGSGHSYSQPKILTLSHILSPTYAKPFFTGMPLIRSPVNTHATIPATNPKHNGCRGASLDLSGPQSL